MTNSTPGIFDGYLVKWKIKNGCPTDGNACLQSDEVSGFPVTEDGEISYFHKTFEWDSVEITFDSSGAGILEGFEIEGEIYSYTIADDEDGEETLTSIPVSSIVTSLEIKSSHPTNNNWKQKGPPVLYGGVGLVSTPVPATLIANDSFSAGVDGETGYNYADVFEKSEFKFYPRNSASLAELKELEVGREEYFQSKPMFEKLTDPSGLAAPIYPMDTITSFVPDERESVDITYTVTLTATDSSGNLISLQNAGITINQTVTQDVNDYGEQLQGLLQICNFTNPQDIPFDEFSEGYPYDYPYTLVSGFEGVDGTPTTRGDDDDNRPLEKGDVWYDKDSGIRYYWDMPDSADDLEVIEGGSRYSDAQSVDTTYLPDLSCGATNDRFGVGMTVDIETKDGEITSAVVNKPGKGYADGDVVVVRAGNNNALLRISITRLSDWTTKFISRM